MLRFRLSGPYQVPEPLLFRLQARYIDIVYPDPPRLRLSLAGGWSAADRLEVIARSGFTSVPPVEIAMKGRHQMASVAEQALIGAWRQSGLRDLLQGEGWAQALAMSGQAQGVPWGNLQPKDRALHEDWQWADPVVVPALHLSWQVARLADAGTAARHRDTDRYGAEWRYTEALPPYRPGTQPLRFRFNGARYQPQLLPPVYFQLGSDLRERPTQPRDQRVWLGYSSSQALDAGRGLAWGAGTPVDALPTGITYPDYDGPITIIEPPVEPDILETYMIANSVSLVVLPERTPLDVTDIKVGLDIDAFSWTFNGSLFGVTSLNQVRPDANGPKAVELTINGWVWVFVIERYSRAAQFPVERYSINGVSRTQLLASPYAPAASAVNAVAINARQVAEDQLFNTGFTLSWDAEGIGPPDWTITAGAMSYQAQTPMQIIARVAEAVGAVVRPGMASDSLTVLPRYREAVWQWGSAIMDRIIPGEVITEVGGEWAPQPAWNSCYVSGTTHGVAVDVRRAGTAGNKPAPDVFDDLITATDAARARGICEISKGGNQEIVPLTIPLFPVGGSAPGLVLPAHLCEVREPSETWRGLCLSVEISATGTGASRVAQALKIERHHAGGA